MVSSKVRPGERTIGAILVESGRLSAKDVERVLQYQRDTELRFGEAGVQLAQTESQALEAFSQGGCHGSRWAGAAGRRRAGGDRGRGSPHPDGVGPTFRGERRDDERERGGHYYFVDRKKARGMIKRVLDRGAVLRGDVLSDDDADALVASAESALSAVNSS